MPPRRRGARAHCAINTQYIRSRRAHAVRRDVARPSNRNAVRVGTARFPWHHVLRPRRKRAFAHPTAQVPAVDTRDAFRITMSQRRAETAHGIASVDSPALASRRPRAGSGGLRHRPAGPDAGAGVARRPVPGRLPHDGRLALRPHRHPDGGTQSQRRVRPHHQPAHGRASAERSVANAGRQGRGGAGPGAHLRRRPGAADHRLRRAQHRLPRHRNHRHRRARGGDVEPRDPARHRQRPRTAEEPRRLRLCRLGPGPARRRARARRLGHGAGRSEADLRRGARQGVGLGLRVAHQGSVSAQRDSSPRSSCSCGSIPICRSPPPDADRDAGHDSAGRRHVLVLMGFVLMGLTPWPRPADVMSSMRSPSRRHVLHLVTAAAGAAALPVLARAAWAQAYPARPVRIIVGLAAGGGTDIVARLIGQWLSERLGQPFVIENRPGSNGNIATEAVVNAAPDGHTLLAVSPGAAINTTLYERLNFEFLRDIAPVAGIMRVANVMGVSLSLPVSTVPEFIAYAKANPDRINMGSAGTGSSNHLSGELFKLMTGVKMVHVPYRGAAPALTDLIDGQVQVLFAAVTSSIEHIKAGKMRALAVTSVARSEALPEVPTVAEFVPGYEASNWWGIGAPKNTPAVIVDRLNQEINAGLADARIKARLAELGGTALPGPPADFTALIAAETEKWAKVIRFAGIKAE